MTEHACTCNYRARTDGCTEWSCVYHGEENRRKSHEVRAACQVHREGKKAD